MLQKTKPDALLLMRNNCGSANLRRAERVVTRHYDRALEAAGITATQLPVLAAIAYGTTLSISELADTLSLERTTVSRELSILKRLRLVATGVGDDRRVKTLRLTPTGQKALDTGYRAWRKAHGALLKAYGSGEFENLLANVRKLGRAAKELAPAGKRR